MRAMLWRATGIMLLLPFTAVAQTAYVTDNLRLGLYEAEDTSGRPMRMLESGQAMEVLSRDRLYANVRLPDSTQGWVKAAYLVDDKPAKLIVAELTAERDGLITELDETRRAFAEPAATIESLRQDVASYDARLVAADTRISELEEENAAIEALQQRYRGSLPLSWVGIAIVVCLAGGVLSGIWWVDHRSRQRHGGIRIY